MVENLESLSELDLEAELARVTDEIRGIDAQFTASRQRINEMKLRKRKETKEEFRTELDWRRRASFAKSKLMEDHLAIKTRLRALRISRNDSGNQFTKKLRTAAQFVVMAYDKGGKMDLSNAVEALRDCLGEAAP